MSLGLVLIFSGLLGFWLAAWVVFREYPESAVATARNTLFALRDQLFELGRSGVISFESTAYISSRRLINGMIRYAHEVSAFQLLCLVLFENRASREYSKQVRRNKELALSAISEEGRKQTELILRRATDAVIQLVVTRSVVLSCLLFFLLIAFKSLHAAKQAGGKLRSSLATSMQKPERSDVENAIEEMLDHRPMRRLRPIISAEASRYSPEIRAGLCAA